MNTVDTVYNQLLNDILRNGNVHHNRTGVDTISVFGRQLRFNLQEGFPLLTCKKVYHKAIVHELLWFLGAVPEEYGQLEQTNIKYLVDNDVHIWDEWPYRKYCEDVNNFNDKAFKAKVFKLKILTQDEFVEKIKTDWAFAAKWGNLGPVYGEQWTNWQTHRTHKFTDIGGQNHETYETINQIAWVVNRIKTNPDCRRIIVNAWNPEYIETALLPPCHYSFQFKSEVMQNLERQKAFNKYTKSNHLDWTGMGIEQAMEHYNFPTRKLHLLWNQRSCDVGLGIPFNIASYGLLLMMVSHVTNHVASDLIASLGDTHVYVNHISQLKEQMKREPYELPELRLNKNIKNIFDFRYDDFEIINYKAHPSIKMQVAV